MKWSITAGRNKLKDPFYAKHWTLSGHKAIAALFTLLIKLDLKTMRDDFEPGPKR